METWELLEKALEFAEKGKGRRLLNTLNKRNIVLTSFELDKVLRIYCEIGLPKEVEVLKARRGLLGDAQYNALAKEVKDNCCSDKYDDFEASLRSLLSCGMTMNPTKMNIEGSVWEYKFYFDELKVSNLKKRIAFVNIKLLEKQVSWVLEIDF